MKQLIIRMTEGEHKKLKVKAARQGISINSLVMNALASDFKRAKNADFLEFEGYKDLSPDSQKIVNKHLKEKYGDEQAKS